MAPYGDEFGIIRFPAPPPPLEQRHVENARLFADRYTLLDSLPKGGTVAEIGVWKGDFSAEILRRVRPEFLHLFDLDLVRFDVRRRFAECAEYVIFHEGDCALTLQEVPDRTFDWIYIDAAHDYESVRRDAGLAAKKIKDRGTLVFNDYLMWSHREALPYGVVRAVNELCVNDGWKVTAFALHNGMYCDIAICRP